MQYKKWRFIQFRHIFGHFHLPATAPMACRGIAQNLSRSRVESFSAHCAMKASNITLGNEL